MTDSLSRTPWSGHSFFTRGFLPIYDWMALGCHCRFIWQCPSKYILEFYNQHISGNHLDIGAGTGYFLDQCKFPVQRPRLALADINPNGLAMAKKRLKRYQPEVYGCNILEPFTIDNTGFDSIGLVNVLHCLPGTMDSKSPAFRNIAALLNPGGILFGTTFISQEVRHSFLAGFTFWWANRLGIMSNKQDTLESLTRNLNQYFEESQVEIHGCEAFFRARKG
jgi:SAM-dependent methyltransferase